jgi:transitional endoplasmic reticulum ATPase
MSDVILTVAEGRPQDAGRGLARLDPADMIRIGAAPGAIVQISGGRVSAVKAMPAFRDRRGRQTVQIDGIVRGNAGAPIGERVMLSTVEAAPAQRIVLVPEGTQLLRTMTAERIGRAIIDMPVHAGDRVRVTIFGSRFQEFRILDTTPRGIVIIRGDTQIRVESPGPAEAGRLSYEDIGGMGQAIRRVREMIELPLRHPEVFARLGIDAPKGVLLHGPPGCGKTLLARAVASETDATFISVSGPEIIHKLYGESEAKLRQVFDEAKKRAPSIVFLDELDAIAPRRDQAIGEVEKRVVAQLLALMDGIDGRGQIVVIGATNLPNALDPALRRPGRFDREIVIGIPDVAGRREMLEIHTRGMPLAADVSIARLADITHGFTGADVAALCREAAMAALRRVLPVVGLDEGLPHEQLLDIEVAMADFMSALCDVEPSALREVFVEIPDVRWDDVGGLARVKDEFREMWEWPLAHADLYREARLRPPKGVLFEGPPGTGKTLLAKAIARESGANFISVKGPELLSKYVGDSEKGIRDVFRKARQASPCIVFFDEVDALAPRRGAASGDGRVSERIVAQLLSEMDGIEDLEGVLVLAATNRADMLDPALLRPGRFDRTITIGLPDAADRAAILRVHARGRPFAPGLDVDALVDRTRGWSGADLEGLMREAAMCAMREHLDRGDHKSATPLRIEARHVDAALREHRTCKGAAGPDDRLCEHRSPHENPS